MNASDKHTRDQCDKETHIIYFRSDNNRADTQLLAQLEKDIGCVIDVCSTWPSMMVQLGIISAVKVVIPVIFVDINVFSQQGATLSEIVNMVSTLHRVFEIPAKMQLSVVIQDKCSIQLIKELYNLDILGIIPCATYFGYEKTLAALKSVLSGKAHWPKDVIDKITGTSSVGHSKTGITLTDRQTQVLSLVCNRGLSNKKIAQALKISESTVKIHVSAILKEYGVRNRTQLALAASSTLKP
jgi:DNA-binding NarL/FixJ family response regulator